MSYSCAGLEAKHQACRCKYVESGNRLVGRAGWLMDVTDGVADVMGLSARNQTPAIQTSGWSHVCGLSSAQENSTEGQRCSLHTPESHWHVACDRFDRAWTLVGNSLYRHCLPQMFLPLLWCFLDGQLLWFFFPHSQEAAAWLNVTYTMG